MKGKHALILCSAIQASAPKCVSALKRVRDLWLLFVGIYHVQGLN